MKLVLALALLLAAASRAEPPLSPHEKRAGIAGLAGLGYLNAEMIWEGHGWLALSADLSFILFLGCILGDGPGKRERAYKDRLAMALFAYSAGTFLSYPFYTMFKGQADHDPARVGAGLLGLAAWIVPVTLSSPPEKPGMRRPDPGHFQVVPGEDGAMLTYSFHWN